MYACVYMCVCVHSVVWCVRVCVCVCIGLADTDTNTDTHNFDCLKEEKSNAWAI